MADNEQNEYKPFGKQFDKCPGCGSEDLFFKGILDELKDRGLVGKEVSCFQFQLENGMPLPQEKIDLLPIGSEIPAYVKVVDTCCECGMVFSTHLEVTRMKKSIDTARPALQIPNRAERRRIERFN